MNPYISRTEMIAALISRPGIKISHQSFTSEEYLYLGADRKVYDENDYLFEDWEHPAACGLRTRQGGAWETGWYIL